MEPVPGPRWEGELLLPSEQKPPVTIYGLCHIKTREVYYVGQSINPRSRWCGHRKMTGHPDTCAMFVIAVVPPEMADKEEAWWISAYEKAGARLFNVAHTSNPPNAIPTRDLRRMRKRRKAAGNWTGPSYIGAPRKPVTQR